jgi:predicted TIM-barrel fold metal-dependent hydrolase
VTLQLKAIDCDVHPTVPGMKALMPYLDDFWRDQVVERDIVTLESIAYPPNAPLTARADWRGRNGMAATTPAEVGGQVLDRWDASIAVCNCLYGVQLVFNEDMAAAFTAALNDYIAAEWLDRDPRLRASIVVPMQNVEKAVEEIERRAADKRFIQVMVLAMGEVPLGRRHNWPIYEAAVRHGLPLAIHAGSAYRHPVTSVGWPTYYLEDYVAQSQGFQAQVASLICEGAFAKFPGLKVVLLESGVTWVPGFLWRFSKFWKGLRTEIPWVDRSPAEIFRRHFALTVQPLDAPDSPEIVSRVIEHLGSEDILLYASDFPHWQFDGDAPLPAAIPRHLARKIMVDNPLATYGRLKESLQ